MIATPDGSPRSGGAGGGGFLPFSPTAIPFPAGACFVLTNVPLSPSTNGLYLNVHKRGRVKTPGYRKWIEDARVAVLAQPIPPDRISGPVALDIDIPFDNRRDASNYIKAHEDMLVREGLIDDDRCVQHVAVHKVAGMAKDTATIRCWSVQE